MKKKGLALALVLMLGLTACGNKSGDAVEDYGGTTEAVEVGKVPASEQGNTTEAYAKEKEEIKPRNGRDLAEQLGGENLSFSGTFNIGQVSGVSQIESVINNTSVLPSYRVSGMTKEAVKEQEIVKALFGDTAQEVKRNIGNAKGDSHVVTEVCEQLCYEFVADYQSDSPKKEFPAWQDLDTSFWHTYEGTSQGMDCQLLIGFDSNVNFMYLSFGPKNWGDAIDKADATEVLELMDDSILSRGDEDRGVAPLDTNLSVLAEPSNQCTRTPEELAEEASKFVSEKLLVKLPKEPLQVKEGEHYSQLLFYPPSASKSETLAGASVNGYRAWLPYTLAGQEYYVDEFGTEAKIRMNQGNVWMNDKGVIGASLYIGYQFEECIADQVAILSFEQAMTATQENIAAELNHAKIPSSSVELHEAYLRYYPTPSPDKQNEFTYIPAWVVPIQQNAADRFAYCVTNATDGSLIEIGYTEE